MPRPALQYRALDRALRTSPPVPLEHLGRLRDALRALERRRDEPVEAWARRLADGVEREG